MPRLRSDEILVNGSIQAKEVLKQGGQARGSSADFSGLSPKHQHEFKSVSFHLVLGRTESSPLWSQFPRLQPKAHKSSPSLSLSQCSSHDLQVWQTLQAFPKQSLALRTEVESCTSATDPSPFLCPPSLPTGMDPDPLTKSLIPPQGKM